MASMLLYGRKSKFCLSVADLSFDFLTGDSIQKIRARDFGAANFGLVSLHITF